MSESLIAALSSKENWKTLCVEWNKSSFACRIGACELLIDPFVVSSNLLEDCRGCVASDSTGENAS